MILIGTYVGPSRRLFNKSALLRPKKDDESVWLAQFDALHLNEAYGWWEFDKQYFINVENLSEPTNDKKGENQ